MSDFRKPKLVDEGYERALEMGALREADTMARLDRVTAERDAMRAQLAERNAELEEFATEMSLAITDSQIRSVMTVIGRSRFLQLLQNYNARIDAALSITEKLEDCDHEWVDARNKYVKSGELCVKCGAIRSGNQTTDGAKPEADHE